MASPLHCNRIAVTVESRCRYDVTATPFGYYRKKTGRKAANGWVKRQKATLFPL